MLSQENKELCQMFADLLDYPEKELPGAARNCAIQLKNSFPNIAKPIQAFAEFVNTQSLETLEELYTQTFDTTPATSLYLGYHLFGETPKRSEFLIRLSDAYQAHALSSGVELADHLGVMLRFLSVSNDAEFTMPLIEECILPTLEKTGKELRKSNSQYALVIEPLLDFLRRIDQSLVKAGGAPNAG